MAALITPSRHSGEKPLDRHLQCLRDHVAVCQIADILLSALISIAQIDGLPLRRQRLAALHRLRVASRQEARVCRSAIAPVYWVPNEILGEIFALCLPSNRRFLPTAAPILLLKVCPLWRNVAAMTCSLWSNVAFWTPKSDTDRTCYPLRFLDSWLVRSGAHPLDIVLEAGLAYNHLRLLVDVVLLARYHQCRHLEIHLTKESAVALLLFVILPPASLASLESLVLDGLDEADFAFEDEYEIALLTAFRDSRQLRKVTTNNLDFTFCFHQSTITPTFDIGVLPWDGLTHLMITDFVQVDIFVVVLAQCNALQFLRVSFDLEDVDEVPSKHNWFPINPTVLGDLTEFHLSIRDGFRFPARMNAFSFPKLNHLRIRRSESESFNKSVSFSWTSSQRFLLQLRGIRMLSLVGRVGAVEEVLFLLERTPAVTHLALDAWTDYQLLIPVLFPLLDASFTSAFLSRPLQQLTHLDLRLECCDFPFPGHRIRDIVDSQAVRLTGLRIVSHRACRKQLLEMHSQFACSPLYARFGIPGSTIGSTRLRTDERLVRDERTNRNYTMFDPVTVNYIG